MDSVGRVPAGSGAPASAMYAPSGEAQAGLSETVVVEAKRAVSGEFMAEAPSATLNVAEAKVQRA